MHTKRTTNHARALALGALVLLSACGQGLGRQPTSQSAAMPTSTPTISPTTSEGPSGQAGVSALASIPEPTAEPTSPPTTEPIPDTVPPRPPRPPRPVASVPTVPTLPVASTIDGLPRQLRRIGGCESSGDPEGPLLWAQPELTGSSTASGAFQALDSTWRTWARTYGAGTDATDYSRAMYAPAATQLAVVVRAHAAEGSAPWAASRACWAG